jgi:hypothetical protein
MRFGSILLLLLAVVGIVLAFNYCGPGKDAVNKAVDSTKNATDNAVNATEDADGNVVDAAKGVTADVMKAGKKPLESVNDLAKRVPEFTSAKQDGSGLYVHAHEQNAAIGPAPAEHVLNSVASQIPGLLATDSLKDNKQLIVYQTVSVKDAHGGDIEQNIFTYTFDMDAIRKANLKEPITMWDVLPFLVEPTGPKVGKDMSMAGMKVRDAICGMNAPTPDQAEMLKASALCVD